MLTLAWRLPEKPQEESADDQRICQLMLLEGGSDSDREEASARVGTPRDSSGEPSQKRAKYETAHFKVLFTAACNSAHIPIIYGPNSKGIQHRDHEWIRQLEWYDRKLAPDYDPIIKLHLAYQVAEFLRSKYRVPELPTAGRGQSGGSKEVWDEGLKAFSDWAYVRDTLPEIVMQLRGCLIGLEQMSRMTEAIQASLSAVEDASKCMQQNSCMWAAGMPQTLTKQRDTSSQEELGADAQGARSAAGEQSESSGAA